MAEDKKPEQDPTSRSATKKKPAAKKAVKKKPGAVVTGAEATTATATTKKVAAKKSATKKPAAKKAAAEKPAARKTTRKKSPAKRATVATPAQPDSGLDIPQAAPQPPPPPTSGAGDYYEADDDSGSLSSLLVTVGPILILGFLILVMSNDRPRVSTPELSVTSTSTEAVEVPVATYRGLTEESLKELIVDDAAKDLAEAFKEAGINLPDPGQEQTPPAASQAIELPDELQNSPWAPQQPGQAAVGENAPPAPGYNQAAGPGFANGQRGGPPPWMYRGQMRGYNPYIPYMGGYPMQPPPGYGMPIPQYPYWGGGAIPGYGVPQGYPPASRQWPPVQGGSPPAPGRNRAQE